MSVVEVTLPDEVYVQFERMVEEEFVSEEQAVEELLTLAIDAYGPPEGEEQAAEFADQHWEDEYTDPGEATDDGGW